MILSVARPFAWAVTLAGLLTTSAQAVPVVEVFTEADAAGNTLSPFLDTVAVDNGIAYAVVRESSGGGGADGAGEIVSFDGSDFETVMTIAQWQTFGSDFDPAFGEGVAVVGTTLRGINFFENSVVEVDLLTGTVSEVVSKAALDAVVGESVNMVADFETLPDGTIYALEDTTNQILAITPSNSVAIEIDATAFASIYGSGSTGGIGSDGDKIYIGSNGNDSLTAWDIATDTFSVILTTAQIEAVTDDMDGNAGFGDIFAAPDGLIYFYESDSDYLLSFDPSDPVGTLEAVITEAEFTAGPSSDTINQLAWYNDRIAFTDESIGFFTVVPEPATLGVAALAAIAGVVRRRRG